MQFTALISDTYRSLKSRGLYWVILWISLLLGLLYASLGCTERGWSIFFGALEFPSSFLKAGTDWERSLLLNVLDLLLDYWMLSLALFLAMFSAATIYPDAMRPGAIDLVLSKPVTRLKVFLAKYFGALLFVSVQAAILAGICFLSLCFRLHTAYWGVFWSVGLATLIFSFVYSFNVLMGVLTRSSMTALMLTMLLWFALWITQKIETETGRAIFSRQVIQASNPDFQTLSTTMDQVHQGTHEVMQFFPKTRETGDLFRRFVKAEAPYSLAQIQFGGADQVPTLFQDHRPVLSVGEVIGSGLVFEFVMLLLAYWRFATRDF